MVQTRAAAKRIESGQEHIPEPSPTKKRRVDREGSPKKRRRGKPGELCQLNLDVLFLLASYVHPLDLLNLARTCKSLRELLMDKPSEFVWKTARRQVEGFPECPDDLTEPEYANLAFFARCHSCGKHAKKILWALRRRYCPDCRSKRLYDISLCPDFIRLNPVLPTESLTITLEPGVWVDKEQKDSFLKEYNDAPDKTLFLAEKQSRCLYIRTHASVCRFWEGRKASQHRFELVLRRHTRYDSIFERLKQHGFESEITHFGHYQIQRSHKPFFRTAKPLTDKEWARMWPEWLVTMNDLRSRRLDSVVYRPRRNLLTSEYDDYVTSPSPNAPTVEILPDHIELRSFQDFRDIIHVPEGTEIGVKPFESAFAQLPALAEEWKQQLDDGFAKLITIPSHISRPRGRPSSSETLPESPQASVENLRLACAVFSRVDDVAFYPEILFLPAPSISLFRYEESQEEAESIQARLRIKFLEEAPYIIHACGLDPNVATAEDMDRQNARIKCLTCNGSWVMNWRNALRHAFFWCTRREMSPPPLPQFQLVSNEHIDAIQAAEASKNGPSTMFRRCLLCLPCIGNALHVTQIEGHLIHKHAVEKDAIQQDVHYTLVGLQCGRWWAPEQVKMVEEGGGFRFI